MMSKQYEQAMARCRAVFEKKHSEYDTSWRILGLPTLTDQMMIKAKRVRALLQRPQQAVDAVVEELIGTVNYATLALIQTRMAGDQRLSVPFDEVTQHYQAIMQEITKLHHRKNRDYGGAWQEMRITSMVDIILMKLLRVKALEDGGEATASVSIKDSYQDIVNYALFCLVRYEKA